MEIAPGIESDEWLALNLDDPVSTDWKTAISIIKARIWLRYIEPIDCLIVAEASKPPKERRFGFTILAVDCLLVETLGAFLDGLTTTDKKSTATFCSCLTRRMPDQFPSYDLAFQFYKQFRCGILHHAEIGGASKVWSVGPIVRIENGAIVVNRTEFHERLKIEFEKYLSELADPTNTQLRTNFKTKMDFISRL